MDTENNRKSFPFGLIFIVLGVIFLLRNFDIIDIGHRWWTLFFLLPITYLMTDILQRRKSNQGKIPPEARGSMIGLITLVTVMTIFVLELNWGMVWPVFIII